MNFKEFQLFYMILHDFQLKSNDFQLKTMIFIEFHRISLILHDFTSFYMILKNIDFE